MLLCNIDYVQLPIVRAGHYAVIVAVQSRCDASKTLRRPASHQ